MAYNGFMRFGDKIVYDVAVVGGGASGLLAALTATGAGAKVALIESSASLGRKILATGNGRCNFTNIYPTAQYHNRDFADPIIGQFDYHHVANVFAELGLLFDADERGWVYPRTRCAASVRDVLLKAVTDSPIEVLCLSTATGVRSVKADGVGSDIWFVEFPSEQEVVWAKTVILACSKPLPLRNSAKITVVGEKPILGHLKVESKFLKQIDGVRARCGLRVVKTSQAKTIAPATEDSVSAQTVFQESGEILFRKAGLSGIVVFNASRYADVGDLVVVDFFAEYATDELVLILGKHINRYLRSAYRGQSEPTEILVGLLHPKLAKFIFDLGLLSGEIKGDVDAQKLARNLKNLGFVVADLPLAQNAQVIRGGYSVEELSNRDLMFKRFTGLFACGECVDVDGPCGGYNLHWAWASGILAGLSAADLTKE